MLYLPTLVRQALEQLLLNSLELERNYWQRLERLALDYQCARSRWMEQYLRDGTALRARSRQIAGSS